MENVLFKKRSAHMARVLEEVDKCHWEGDDEKGAGMFQDLVFEHLAEVAANDGDVYTKDQLVEVANWLIDKY